MAKSDSGRVTFDEEKCLWRCMPFLKREMDSGAMMQELAKEGVLCEKDQQFIRSKPTNSERNSALIDIIMNSTSDSFLEFVIALDTTGHKVAYQTVLEAHGKESESTYKKFVSGSGPSEFVSGTVFGDN
ncbi:apoptotic protease-activating factor 1-like [Littorina saxatilis]|uniref:apoptotic protease-activating factor 1-like n=1 Tax=Littorina saxatilis TaxID=31220 RepID=UPI0038B573A7